MRPEEQDLSRLGVVTGTHGLRGDLKVRPLTPDAHALLDARTVFLRRDGEEPVAYRPDRASAHKAHILLHLEGMGHIDAVESLVGCDVLVRRDDLPAPPEGEPYWMDMQGMSVSDRTLGELGTLDDVFSTAAHDIYVVNGRYGEVLIPVVEEFMVEVDHDRRRLLVDLPEGLVAKPDEV